MAYLLYFDNNFSIQLSLLGVLRMTETVKKSIKSFFVLTFDPSTSPKKQLHY